MARTAAERVRRHRAKPYLTMPGKPTKRDRVLISAEVPEEIDVPDKPRGRVAVVLAGPTDAGCYVLQLVNLKSKRLVLVPEEYVALLATQPQATSCAKPRKSARPDRTTPRVRCTDEPLAVGQWVWLRTRGVWLKVSAVEADHVQAGKWKCMRAQLEVVAPAADMQSVTSPDKLDTNR